jgi:hypothetical protein
MCVNTYIHVYIYIYVYIYIGKRGRTKYTHLMDQDTTKFNERYIYIYIYMNTYMCI